MKKTLTSINITLSKKAHDNLTKITEETKTNQSVILNAVLEKIDVEKIMKEMQDEQKGDTE